MNIRKLIVLLLLFMFVGCRSNSFDEEYTAPVFKQTFDRDVVVLNDDFIFDFANCIAVVDSLLITAFQTSSSYGFFHVFNKHTGECLKSFGGIGRGPGEMLTRIASYSLDPTSKKLYAKGYNDPKIVVFDISQAMGESSVPFEEIQIDTHASSVTRDDFHYKDDIFLFRGNRAFRYALLNSNLDTLATYHAYPIITEEDVNNEYARKLFYTAYSAVGIKPDRTKFVNTTRNGLLMEIFDILGNKIELAYLWRYIKPSYIADEITARYVKDPGGITAVSVTDNYIYTVLCTNRDENITANNLWVFDWGGQPVKQYKLDKNVVSIVIDEDEGVAYAQIAEKETVCLGKFQL